MQADAPLIILNPTAGAGRAARMQRLLRSGGELVVTERAGHAERLAADATADGRPRVIAVGGDGTLQEVVNGLAGAPNVVLGVVPAGAGNDFARSLGLPRDPHAALAVALHGHPRPVDVGEATGADGRVRRFVAAGGAGFDAQVAAAMAGTRSRWQRGRAGYLWTTLRELRQHHNAEVRICFQDGDNAREDGLAVLLVAFANGAYYGGGMRIAPDARSDDGALDLCIVGDISRLEAMRQLPSLYRGRHVDHPAVRMRRAAAFELEGDAPVHLDGEPFGRLPISVRAIPEAILVAAPAPASV